MPPSRIIADAQGNLQVPDEPIVPVVEGDGSGPDVWRATRRILDAAIAKATPKRRVQWVSLAAGERAARELNDRVPEATVNGFRLYRVGLVGWVQPDPDDGPSLGRELREILDLYLGATWVRGPRGARLARTPSPLDLVLVHDEREEAAAGLELRPHGARGLKLLDLLAEHAPAAHDALGFANAAKAEAHAAANDWLPTGFVEAALALRPASRLGAERLARGAAAIARSRPARRLAIVHDSARNPLTDGALRDWAIAGARETGPLFTRDQFDSLWKARGRPAADEALEKARAAGALAWEELRAGAAIERVLLRPAELDVIAGPSSCAMQLEAVVAPLAGPGLAARSHANPETGHAVFGPAAPPAEGVAPNPCAMLHAGELLLRQLGWLDAAGLVRDAVDACFAAGEFPAELGARVREAGRPDARELSCEQFRDAVLARLAA